MRKFLLLVSALGLLNACTKDTLRYPEGQDKIYYTLFDYSYDDLGNPVLSNASYNLDKSSSELMEIGVKLMSKIERDYDIEVRMYVRNSDWFLTQIKAKKTPGMFSTPDSLAVPGVDFALLDEDLNAISPVRTDSLTYYRLVFPKARKDIRKVYLKSLNNQDYSCQRFLWLSLAIGVPSYETREELETTMYNNVDFTDYMVKTYSKSWLKSIILK